MKILKTSLAIFAAIIVLAGCKKTNTSPAKPHLVFKFVFDSTQVRLNSLGQPDSTFPGNLQGRTLK
jgi:hypothetical protein